MKQTDLISTFAIWGMVLIWLFLYRFSVVNYSNQNILISVYFFIAPIVTFVISIKSFRQKKSFISVLNLIISSILLLFLIGLVLLGSVFD
jgi:putative effector of murein hydrolase LrgA (UPF0299 family)